MAWPPGERVRAPPTCPGGLLDGAGRDWGAGDPTPPEGRDSPPPPRGRAPPTAGPVAPERDPPADGGGSLSAPREGALRTPPVWPRDRAPAATGRSLVSPLGEPVTAPPASPRDRAPPGAVSLRPLPEYRGVVDSVPAPPARGRAQAGRSFTSPPLVRPTEPVPTWSARPPPDLVRSPPRGTANTPPLPACEDGGDVDRLPVPASTTSPRREALAPASRAGLTRLEARLVARNPDRLLSSSGRPLVSWSARSRARKGTGARAGSLRATTARRRALCVGCGTRPLPRGSTLSTRGATGALVATTSARITAFRSTANAERGTARPPMNASRGTAVTAPATARLT